ncbi:MAG: ABC transporter [Chloroflexi bacterium RBG_16_48_8]|nr:MAG: ABC transporter [Chloroflexi bacterium RBG_16_48_8]
MMKEMKPVLIAQRLSKSFPNGSGDLVAIENVSFSLMPQEFLCVVGPSGCGKTTLLKLLAGLLEPTRGEIFIEGQLHSRPRRRIGFVFQEANLMPWRTVHDNIALPLELQGISIEEIEQRTQTLIQLVGLETFEDNLPRDLSGGMAQRVAIARALIHNPDILLLDEPFGALDALTRERMGSELMRIWSARKVTVIMVTHSISEAVLLSDRIIVLSSRPGTVRLDTPNNLPRPRQLEMTHTQAFGDLAHQVRQAIA